MCISQYCYDCFMLYISLVENVLFKLIKKFDTSAEMHQLSTIHPGHLVMWQLYPGDMWTHFNSTAPRINNGCEGYNSRLSWRVVIVLIPTNLHLRINQNSEAGACQQSSILMATGSWSLSSKEAKIYRSYIYISGFGRWVLIGSWFKHLLCANCRRCSVTQKD